MSNRSTNHSDACETLRTAHKTPSAIGKQLKKLKNSLLFRAKRCAGVFRPALRTVNLFLTALQPSGSPQKIAIFTTLLAQEFVALTAVVPTATRAVPVFIAARATTEITCLRRSEPAPLTTIHICRIGIWTITGPFKVAAIELGFAKRLADSI